MRILNRNGELFWRKSIRESTCETFEIFADLLDKPELQSDIGGVRCELMETVEDSIVKLAGNDDKLDDKESVREEIEKER